MRVTPHTPGEDDGETFLSESDDYWYLYECEAVEDTHARRDAMQTGLGSDTIVDLKENR